MKIPTPEQTGLPSHITKYRAGQEELIHLGLTSTKRVVAACAPTGFGKTDVAVAIALLSKKPTCIVTYSKGLQDQYMRQYACIGMVDIRGRNNYKCDMKPEDPSYTCEHGYASRCMYKGTVACGASQAEMRAAASSLVVTNYSKWCHSRKFGQGMSHFEQVIFDEFHHSYDALASAIQVTLHDREIVENLKLEFLKGYEAQDMMYWKGWACNARAIAEIAMIAAQARISGLADPKPAWVKHFTHMRNLTRKLATLATCNPNDWVVEESEDGYVFDPVRPGKYAESALLLHVPKVIGLSATLRPKSLFMIGLGREQFDFKEFDSTFDPRRCPIYYIPTMPVDSRHPDNSMLWIKLDQIASPRRHLNGIVHTVSYARKDEIKNTSRHCDRMLFNSRGEAPTRMVEEFKSSRGAIMVTPSVGTGYDFPMDECRWQFMTKVPFEPPSKVQKARSQDDKEYSAYRAMQYLVQAFGRDMRSDKDWSQRFICDTNFEWFYPKFRHLAPASFHALVQTVHTVPPLLDVEKL